MEDDMSGGCAALGAGSCLALPVALVTLVLFVLLIVGGVAWAL